MARLSPPALALGAIAVAASLIVVMLAAAVTQFGLVGFAGALALIPLAVAANVLVRFDRHLAGVSEACRLAANGNRSADFSGFDSAEEFHTLMAAVERISRRASQPADCYRPVVDEAIRVCHAAAAGDLDQRIAGHNYNRAVCNDLARAVNQDIEITRRFLGELDTVLEEIASGGPLRSFSPAGFAGRHAELATTLNAVLEGIAVERAATRELSAELAATRRLVATRSPQHQPRPTGAEDPAVAAMLADLHRAAGAISAAMRILPVAAVPPRTRLARPAHAGPFAEIAEITSILADRAVLVAASLEEPTRREPPAPAAGAGRRAA